MSKYIFLDRDGTVIKDKYYMYKPEDIEFLPKAINGLRKLMRAGFEFIIVTNQAGVRKGYYSRDQALRFHDEFLKQLHRHQIVVKESYFCFHQKEDQCDCRKPKPGLVRQARSAYGIRAEESIFIGDKDCDILLGRQCGGMTVRIDNRQYRCIAPADHVVRTLEEAADLLGKKNT